jgi:hypothetical protein
MTAIMSRFTQRRLNMENSVYQARWVLAPLFGLCVAIAFVGIVLS